MKTGQARSNFARELLKHLKQKGYPKKGETHIISVNANFGRYEIVLHPSDGKSQGAPVEISGSVHHFFVTPKQLSAQPSKKQVRENLKNTIILKNLTIRLKDPKGDGRHLEDPTEGPYGIHAEGFINLAGKEGERLKNEAEQNRRYSMAAYKIIQQDILHAIKKEGLREQH